jgi:hypothetical protein
MHLHGHDESMPLNQARDCDGVEPDDCVANVHTIVNFAFIEAMHKGQVKVFVGLGGN